MKNIIDLNKKIKDLKINTSAVIVETDIESRAMEDYGFQFDSNLSIKENIDDFVEFLYEDCDDDEEEEKLTIDEIAKYSDFSIHIDRAEILLHDFKDSEALPIECVAIMSAKDVVDMIKKSKYYDEKKIKERQKKEKSKAKLNEIELLKKQKEDIEKRIEELEEKNNAKKQSISRKRN